ncbi:hypothetical protein CC80DRAFT_508125 [Byssothecium circinans]|uniref:Uncharacterized protein n=1 Tax=Byssothecium circinans TaxID=147558 RepID=A0A6A5TTX8_9PLEO|nr:hypothetical protein CC80DRAFT_508125 [Byssothecium circinans]
MADLFPSDPSTILAELGEYKDNRPFLGSAEINPDALRLAQDIRDRFSLIYASLYRPESWMSLRATGVEPFVYHFAELRYTFLKRQARTICSAIDTGFTKTGYDMVAQRLLVEAGIACLNRALIFCDTFPSQDGTAWRPSTFEHVDLNVLDRAWELDPGVEDIVEEIKYADDWLKDVASEYEQMERIDVGNRIEFGSGWTRQTPAAIPIDGMEPDGTPLCTFKLPFHCLHDQQ